MKDWTGNNRTLGATLGASYLASGERPREDYYATHPDMVRDLLNAGAPLRKRVWEPACGAGHIVNVLRERGHEVYATDIVTVDVLIPAYKISCGSSTMAR